MKVTDRDETQGSQRAGKQTVFHGDERNSIVEHILDLINEVLITRMKSMRRLPSPAAAAWRRG